MKNIMEAKNLLINTGYKEDCTSYDPQNGVWAINKNHWIYVRKLEHMIKSGNDLQQFRKKQPTVVWIELVLNVRCNIMHFKKLFHVENTDCIFINLLKLLVAKKAGGLKTYLIAMAKILECEGHLPNVDFYMKSRHLENKTDMISYLNIVFGEDLVQTSTAWNTSKNINMWLEIYRLHLCFVETLYDLWQTWSRNGENESVYKDWPLLKSWVALDATEIGQLELFVRARWGGDLLTMLNCTKDDVKWWKTTTPASLQHEVVLYDWLPNLPVRPRQMALTSLSFDNNLVWNIVHRLIPPLLGKKYHIIDAEGICDEGRSHCSSTAVVAWFVHYQEFVGKYFFTTFQKLMDKRLLNLHEGNFELNSWKEDMNHLNKVLIKMQDPNFIGSPKYSHQLAKSSAEFLLEPAVLIQVPWNSTIREQWLSAALIEIMMFEYDAMELRHWPIPVGQMEVCARELLTMVAQIKDRILLALFVHYRNSLRAKQRIQRIHGSILMEKVVAYSTPVLELLCSRKASGMVWDLKQVLYAKASPLLGDVQFVYLSPDVYSVKPAFLSRYLAHYWHIGYWINSEEFIDGFNAFLGSQPANVVQLMQKLTTEIPSANTKLNFLMDISLEESYLMNKLMGKKGFTRAKGHLVKNIFPHIMNIFTSGFFPEELHNEVKTKIIQQSTKEMISKQPASLEIVCELYDRITYYLSQCPANKQNVQTCLVQLSGELLLKQQHCRLVSMCAHLLQISPVIPHLGGSSLMVDFNVYIDTLRQVHKNSLESDRGSLLNQLNPEWTSPKDFNTPQLHTLLDKMLQFQNQYPFIHDLFNQLEMQNNRVVYNKSADIVPELESKKQTCEIQHKNNLETQPSEYLKRHALLEAVKIMENRTGAMVRCLASWSCDFDDDPSNFHDSWCELQYLMPCFLSSIVALAYPPNKEINLNLAQNLVNFYAAILNTYEQSCSAYSREQGTCQILKPTSFSKSGTFEVSHVMSQFYGSQVLAILSFHAPKDEGLNSLIESLNMCPYQLQKHEKKVPKSQDVTELLIYVQTAWQKICFNLSKNLYQIANRVMEMPIAGQFIDSELVTRLYVLHCLDMRILMYYIILTEEDSKCSAVIPESNGCYQAYQTLRCQDPRRMTKIHHKIIEAVWNWLANLRQRLSSTNLPFKHIPQVTELDSDILSDMFKLYIDNNIHEIYVHLHLKQDKTMTFAKVREVVEKASKPYDQSRRDSVNKNDCYVDTFEDPAIGRVSCSKCGIVESKPRDFIRIRKTGQIYYICSVKCNVALAANGMNQELQ